MQLQIINGHAVNGDLTTFIGLYKTGQHIGQCGFTTTRTAHQGDRLPGLNIKAHAFDHRFGLPLVLMPNVFKTYPARSRLSQSLNSAIYFWIIIDECKHTFGSRKHPLDGASDIGQTPYRIKQLYQGSHESGKTTDGQPLAGRLIKRNGNNNGNGNGHKKLRDG